MPAEDNHWLANRARDSHSAPLSAAGNRGTFPYGKGLARIWGQPRGPGRRRCGLMLRALAADGYDIDDADLVDRRAEAARVKAELYRRFREGG